VRELRSWRAVEGGLGGLDAADAPLAEDLGVVALGDELVDRVRRGLGHRRSLRGDEPDRVVLIWPRNFVFATWVASYFGLSVGPEQRSILPFARPRKIGRSRRSTGPSRARGRRRRGGVAQGDRAGVVHAARPAGIGQWLLDA
jgi:hypothetical protein